MVNYFNENSKAVAHVQPKITAGELIADGNWQKKAGEKSQLALSVQGEWLCSVERSSSPFVFQEPVASQ